MTNTTLPTLTTAAAVADPDLFIIRRSGQTSDQQIHARDILAYISASTSGFSVTADQITDATAVGKSLLRAATTAAALDAAGGGAVGKAVFAAATTAVALDSLGGTAYGKATFQATSTAAAQNLLEAGTVGLQVWKTATTAAALDALGHGTYGKNFIAVSTTAAAQNYLEAGTVGLQVWKTATTAAALDALGGGTAGKNIFAASTTAAAQNLLEAGSAGLNIFKASTTAAAQNLLEAGAAGLTVFKASTTAAIGNIIGVVSAGFATSAQATAGTSDGTYMNPVNTRNAIEKFAFTSANYASTAQATTGTDATTVMNPVLTKNAISSLGGGAAGVTAIASGTLSTGSPTVVDITNIPQTYRSLRLTIKNASNSVATRALRVTIDNGLGLGNAGNDAILIVENQVLSCDQNLYVDHTQTAAQKSNVVVDIYPGYQSASAYQTYAVLMTNAETVDDTFTNGTQIEGCRGILSTAAVARFGAIVGIRMTWDNVATGVFDGGTYLLEGIN